MVKITTAFLLILINNYVMSQKINTRYRTVIEDNQPLHYIIFTNSQNCQLSFPANHGEAMMGGKRVFEFDYKTKNDTITFAGNLLDTNNSIVKRIIDSRFIKKSNRIIYDYVSGYTYVDKKIVNDKFIIISFDGKIYKQKKSKTDGYGLVKRNYKANGRLKRKAKDINKDNYTINIIKGKEAYNKYGIRGMNGVIEVVKKK